MKQYLYKFIYIALVITILFSSSKAYAVPNTISFQGKLNDSSGQSLNGDYSIIFIIYDAPSGGNPLWTESWNGANTVHVVNGLFTVELGSISPLSPAIFDKDELYLGIRVESDNEMAPRQKFTTGPFSFRSEPISPIQHYKSSFNFLPGQWGVWKPLKTIIVPAGELWEIYSVWEWTSLGNENYYISQLRINVDGIINTPSATGGGYAIEGYGYKGCSGYNGFFLPPLRAYPGQNVTLEGYISVPHMDHCNSGGITNTNCVNEAKNIEIGIYYYKKNL